MMERRNSGGAARERERGAVLLLVVLGLPVLIAFCALVIDLGQLFVVRTKLQATADATALAAASQLPDEPSVRSLAHEYAELNYSGHGTIVDDEDIVLGLWDGSTFTAQDSDAFPLDADPNAVRVAARRMESRDNGVRLIFGAFVGKRWGNVSAAATARMANDPGFPAIFAGGTNCPNSDVDDAALMWDADDVTVLGDVHSNGFLWVDGDGNTINDGDLTYVTGEEIVSGNDFPTPRQVDAREFPLMYPDGHFDPAHSNFAFDLDDDDFHFYTANQSFNSTPANGIHVVEGNLTINVDGMTGSFTFVSLTGRINVHGDEKNLTAYYDNLLFYAPRHGSSVSCSEPSDIRLEDDDNHFTGNVLAPKGRIWIDGADDWELNGSLIGWAITLEGDNLSFRVEATGGGTGQLQLVQ